MSEAEQIIRALIKKYGPTHITKALSDVTEEMGLEDGCKPEKDCTYIVLRIEYTTHLDANLGIVKHEVTYVPWYIKDDKRTYLEDKGVAYNLNSIDPNNRVTTVTTIINFTRHISGHEDFTQYEQYKNSIIDIQDSPVEDKYGRYLHYNWYKYESRAEKCCEGWEARDNGPFAQSADYTLYRLEL